MAEWNPIHNWNHADEILLNEHSKNTNDAIIFAIDASTSMQNADSHALKPITAAIRSAKDLILRKIYQCESEAIAVVFFNTRVSRNESDLNGLYVLSPLDLVEPTKILELEALEDIAEFEYKIGAGDQIPLPSLLQLVKDIFKKHERKYFSHRLFFVTNNDDPNESSLTSQNSNIKQAQEMFDSGIKLLLFAINPPHKPFDVDIFYRKILDLHYVNIFSAVNVDNLDEEIRLYEARNHAVWNIPFQITENLTIGVKGYALIVEQKKHQPKLIYTQQQEIQAAKTESIWNAHNSQGEIIAENIKKSNMKYIYEYGSEKVVFKAEEIDHLRFKTPNEGMKLLGFRDSESLPFYYNMQHSYFIYPDEKTRPGSTTLFKGLLIKMHEKKKLAICSFSPQKNSNPQLAVILPQLEEIDEKGRQKLPPGFNVVILPFSDDLRSTIPTRKATVDDAYVSLAAELVDRLCIDNYSPDLINNPTRFKIFSAIEAAALGRQGVQDFVDETKSNTEEICKQIQQLSVNYNQAFSIFAATSEGNNRKRLPSDYKNSTEKKDRVDVRSFAENGQLNKVYLSMLNCAAYQRAIKALPCFVRGQNLYEKERRFNLRS